MLEFKLFEASPAWAIEDDTLIGFDLAFTQGLRLRGIDTVCATDETLEELSRALSEMLCSIPDDCVVRFHSLELVGHEALLRGFEQQFSGDPIGGYVARKKAEQCDVSVSPRRREQLCFVTTPPMTTFSGYNWGARRRSCCGRHSSSTPTRFNKCPGCVAWSRGASRVSVLRPRPSMVRSCSESCGPWRTP